MSDSATTGSPVPDLSPRRRRVGTLEVTWGDCDAAGVVFYPRYYAWFDACTHALLTQAGLDHHALRRLYELIGTPLVQSSARYLSSATFGDTLTTLSHISKLGRRSFTVTHRFFVGDRLIVEGEEVRVWARAAEPGSDKAFQAIEPPEGILARLEAP